MIDLLIIGGGPAGYKAAEKAGKAGLRTVLFEKETVGGVCLNQGCIPTKTLLYSAKTYRNAIDSNKYGIKYDNVQFDYSKILARKKKVVRKLVLGVQSALKRSGVEIVNGEAYIVGKTDNGFEVRSNNELYIGKNILICTGSKATVPPIPGEKEAKDIVLTSTEMLSLTELPKSLVIIGGGVIGMEFASICNSFGVDVTIVEMLPEILGPMDNEISAVLRDNYSSKGIKFNLGARVIQIDGHKVVFEKEGEHHAVNADNILLSVGRQPITKGFGLENLGVEMNRNAIKTDEYLHTSVPGVYAAGDVNGISLLAHTASREGEVAVNNILADKSDVMSYKAIASVVYTNPEVAGVGETEESAKAKNITYKVQKLPMTYAGRFVAENEQINGLCKILTSEETGKIIGVHILGNPASEIIYGAGIAVEQGMTPEQLQHYVFPHPTVSEILAEVCRQF